MDAIGSLLDGPRARGAFLLKVELEPPWAMRIEDESPLSLIILTCGAALVAGEGDPAQPLRSGDVVVARGPTHYTVSDEEATPPQVRILPGPRCVSVTGTPLDEPLGTPEHGWQTPAHGYTGVRTWGNSRDGSTQLLVGTYRTQSAVGDRLMTALPRLAVLPGFATRSGAFQLLGEEVAADAPGQGVVLDRLLDLLLVAALRAWFARPDAHAPRWYRAGADPEIGPVLRMITDDPAENWTVATLAAQARLSRAGFARRFTQLVGEPPMTFLTGWRLAVAADLLTDTDATLESVAVAVGYSTPFALSTAFKRRHGLSPQDYRRRAALHQHLS